MKKLFSHVFVALTLVAMHISSSNASCNVNSPCSGGLCCSKWGYCGTGPEYCGEGCQSNCPSSANAVCSSSKPCSGGLCCSKWGYCGMGPEYCGEGCQANCQLSGNAACSSTKPCSGGFCCSKWGYCGIGPEYCGAGCLSNCGGQTGGGGSSNNTFGVTQSQFNSAITSCGFAAPPTYKYNSFAASIPPAGITSKDEVAMFLANIVHNSGGLQYVREVNPMPGAYDYNSRGVQFYGRGYMQLAWSYNYKNASSYLFNDNRLYDNPDQVASNEDIAWSSASWYWFAKVHNAPGVTQGDFDATIRAINGDIECPLGVCNTPQAANRRKYYASIRNAFGL